MKAYNWQGINSAGMRVQGIANAGNAAEVKLQLEKQHIVVIKTCKNSGKRVSAKHIADFSRQLATMINAEVPLLSALSIIEQSYEHSGMCNLIVALKDDIAAGVPLSAALKKHPRYFDELFSNLVYAGEQAGKLAKMLSHVADYKERIALLKRKIKKAMFYPVIVLLMAVIVTVVLLIFVVPQFAQLFKGFGAALPIYTQFIISLSNLIKNYGFYILILLAGCGIIFKLLSRNTAFAFKLDKLLLKIPVFGKILQQAAIARLTRTLAITFTAGITLNAALQIIAGTAGNRVYQQAILDMRQAVMAGQTIASAMGQNQLFPKRVIQMIHIGEESGALDVMLMKIAEYYEMEVNHIVDNLSNLIEPLIMTILGILVGGLIIGMYLPIFKLGTVI